MSKIEKKQNTNLARYKFFNILATTTVLIVLIIAVAFVGGAIKFSSPVVKDAEVIFRNPGAITGESKTLPKCAESPQDPLGIDGHWSYETILTTPEQPSGVDGIIGYGGTNTIEIGSDCTGYTMTGQRTYKLVRRGTDVRQEADEQTIKISRVVADIHNRSFSFHFEVSQNKGMGFSELQLDPGSNIMNGTIHYLFPGGKWKVVKIKFIKNDRS